MSVRRNWIAAIVAVLALAVLLRGSAANPPVSNLSASAPSTPAAKKSKPVPGEEIFDNRHVLALRIEISTNELKVLSRNDRQDVRATVFERTSEGTNVWRDVALHVKGAAGSRQGIDAKPALTLSFGKFTPNQRFHGLRKIHLNNSVQDRSYMTENICGELFRKAGVPAPRVSYATLELNGKKRGFYVLKEGFTKDMLGLYFKKTGGNLYDGGFLQEITAKLENDGGGDDDVKDWSDLKGLAKAAQEPDVAKRWDELNETLDVSRFITFCALEVMMWDWDGYFMNRNNYRVYHDLDTGKMVFFPHGMDQMFWEPNHPMLPPERIQSSLVGRAVLTTPQGRKLYRERFGQVFTNVFQIEALTNRVNELERLIGRHIKDVNDLNAFNERAQVVRNQIIAQHANFTKRLSEPEPKPLAFTGGFASITNWAIPLSPPDRAKAIRDRVQIDGKTALHILTTNKMTNTTASWRAGVLLSEGSYRLEALAKVSGVVSMMNTNKGGGAGIRHSGIRTPRRNSLEGDSGWQKLTYEFELKYEEEVHLLCELQATEGEVWFDEKSFRLEKVK